MLFNKSSILLLMLIFMSACGDNGGSDNDITPPIIEINGESIITLDQGSNYIELGATASDNQDGNVEIVITGTVDTAIPGTYIITYIASDSFNNVNTISRTVNVIASNPFITTWKTDNGGYTNNNQIKIGTAGYGYNYHIDWGDGQSNSFVSSDITHTYATAGTYTVSISGLFPRLFFDDSEYDNEKLLSVEQWGNIQWQSMNRAFYKCRHFVINASDVPDLSQVNNMDWMFARAESFNQDLSQWDVSSVTSMSFMFFGAKQFNQELSSWDVSSVTDMSYMFFGTNDFNQNISNWNVSSVTKMGWMFYNADSFNQSLGSWDVSNVSNMSSMFFSSDAFNQDINAWDISSVTNMSFMFSSANSFNQNISDWNVSLVTDMSYMFAYANNFDQDLSRWNVSKVSTMENMFLDITLSTTNYDALLIGWSTQNLQNNVVFNAGNSTYSNSSQGSKDVLTNVFNWSINDNGIEPL